MTASIWWGGSCDSFIAASKEGLSLRYESEQKDKLAVVVPSEGTGCEIGSVAILADGPDQEAAKQFYEFSLSPECQELAAQYGAYQFP